MKEGDVGIRQDGSHLSSEPIWWMWAVDHQVVRSLSEKYPQDQQAAAFCSGCSGVKPQPDLCTARTRITLRDEKFLCSWVTSLISWELGGSGYVSFLNGGSEVVLIKDVICIIMPMPLCVKLGTCEGKSSCILPSFALPIPKWSASDGKLCKSKQWCLSSFEGFDQQWELTTAARKGVQLGFRGNTAARWVLSLSQLPADLPLLWAHRVCDDSHVSAQVTSFCSWGAKKLYFTPSGSWDF